MDNRVQTLSLPGAIAYVRGIFRNEIDKMMEVFKASAPDFYTAYFAARNHRSRRHAQGQKGYRRGASSPAGGSTPSK